MGNETGSIKYKKILLVDDDEADTYIAKRIIKSTGFADKIITISSGVEALKYIEDLIPEKSQLPEIIFVDLKMPGLDGYEFLDEMKKISEKNNIRFRIVILTNAVNPGRTSSDKTIDYLMFEKILVKPLTAQALESI